jgi:hypothetical protein
MENIPERPTPSGALAALTDAEASRAALAHGIATPSWLFTSIGAAIATHIATTAIGLGDGAPWLVAAGLAIFAAVAWVQLVRFQRLNGVWLGGFASRVVLGTGNAASASYVIALGAAIWAAFAAGWWFVALWSIAGGAAYAFYGRRWMRAYRDFPAVHARGESRMWLALFTVAAAVALALLLIGG